MATVAPLASAFAVTEASVVSVLPVGVYSALTTDVPVVALTATVFVVVAALSVFVSVISFKLVTAVSKATRAWPTVR